VAEDERKLGLAELAVDDMEIGSANTTGVHLQSNLSGPDARLIQVDPLQRGIMAREEDRLHAGLSGAKDSQPPGSRR
jgi:hypothetical protein